jgi:hypothetical protein
MAIAWVDVVHILSSDMRAERYRTVYGMSVTLRILIGGVSR